MTANITAVTINDSLWNQAAEEGRSEADTHTARKNADFLAEALRGPHEIFMLNGQAVTGDVRAEILLRSDKKALQIMVIPDKKGSDDIVGPSSYTSIDLAGLSRDFDAIYQREKVVTSIAYGEAMMTQGPLREFIALAATALPSLKAPKQG